MHTKNYILGVTYNCTKNVKQLSLSVNNTCLDYDIILPRFQDPYKISKRSVDSGKHPFESNEVIFTAFDEDHHLILERNVDFLKPGLQVKYLEADGSIREEPVKTRHCHFFAKSLSHEGSEGALTTCGGLV